jgi:Uma2 family endonuclease
MAGGTVEHAALSMAIGGLLMAHLRGGSYRACSSDLRIRIREAEVATYADAAIVCDPVERDPDSPTHVTNPRVVVEVLSRRERSEGRRIGEREGLAPRPEINRSTIYRQPFSPSTEEYDPRGEAALLPAAPIAPRVRADRAGPTPRRGVAARR